MHACIYVHARLATQMNGSPIRERAASVSARVFSCAIGRPRIRAETCARLPIGVDRVWFGAQAFAFATAFNANIGAWNTASVFALSNVCAGLSAWAARHRGRDALGGLDI
jgi:hypothetical protein